MGLRPSKPIIERLWVLCDLDCVLPIGIANRVEVRRGDGPDWLRLGNERSERNPDATRFSPPRVFQRHASFLPETLRGGVPATAAGVEGGSCAPAELGLRETIGAPERPPSGNPEPEPPTALRDALRRARRSGCRRVECGLGWRPPESRLGIGSRAAPGCGSATRSPVSGPPGGWDGRNPAGGMPDDRR